MPDMTDADHLAQHWAKDTTEMGADDDAQIAKLIPAVVEKGVWRYARRMQWHLTIHDVHDITNDAYLAFRVRVASHRKREQPPPRGGILFKVVEDQVLIHVQRWGLNGSRFLSLDREDGPGGDEGGGSASQLLIDFGNKPGSDGDLLEAARALDKQLIQNYELGVRSLAKLMQRERRDPEVELWAEVLLERTTNPDLFELDAVEAVRQALISKGWTPQAVNLARDRAMRRPEVSAILERYQGVIQC